LFGALALLLGLCGGYVSGSEGPGRLRRSLGGRDGRLGLAVCLGDHGEQGGCGGVIGGGVGGVGVGVGVGVDDGVGEEDNRGYYKYGTQRTTTTTADEGDGDKEGRVGRGGMGEWRGRGGSGYINISNKN
jgi:hypothetical protein